MAKRIFKIYRYDPDKDAKPYMQTVEIELSGTLRPMHDRLTALIARTVGKPRSKVSSWTFFNAVLGATFINVLHPPPRDARGRAPFRLEAEVIALADDYLRRYLGG